MFLLNPTRLRYYLPWRLLLSVLIAVCIVSPRFAKARDKTSMEARLQAEALPHWEAYRQYWKMLQGSSVGERRDSTGTAGSQKHSQYSKHWKTGMVHRIELSTPGSYAGSIHGDNSRYKFVLVRDNATKPWVVQNITKKSDQNDMPSSLATIGLSLDTPGRTVPDLLRSPDFTLTSVTGQHENGEQLVRVIFAYSPRDKDLLRGGWIDLDPIHDWVIRRAELELQGDGQPKIKYAAQYKYKEGSDHHPIILKSSHKSTTTQGDRVLFWYEIVTDFDLQEESYAPETEFTLSAFGFPEPFGMTPKRTPWYLWLGLAGALCVALGAVFLRLKRRAAA
jgi:hypothetical protein